MRGIILRAVVSIVISKSEIFSTGVRRCADREVAMGRSRSIGSLARLAVAFALAAVTFAAAALHDSRPARADWFEYGINGAPMCPGAANSCPTLETSCQ